MENPRNPAIHPVSNENFAVVRQTKTAGKLRSYERNGIMTGRDLILTSNASGRRYFEGDAFTIPSKGFSALP